MVVVAVAVAMAMALAVTGIERAMVMPYAMTKTAAVIIAAAATVRIWAIVAVARLVTVRKIRAAVVAAHVDDDNVRVVARRSCVYSLVWRGPCDRFSHLTNAYDTDDND